MKPEKELTRIGKFLSLVLRHQPQQAGITLDKNGWADVALLMKNLALTLPELDWIVENNNKKRFTYNDDKTKIRANQGHSLSEVEVEMEEVTDAPEFLYHGTSSAVVPLLQKEGIKKMSRNHVHLSKDLETAVMVGKRKSSDIVILKIKAKEMIADGHTIYISKNGVYLTEFVDPKYVALS